VALAALPVAAIVFGAASASATTQDASTQQDLETFFADGSVTQINVLADITLTCPGAGGVGQLDRSENTNALTIVGNGHTIRQTCLGYRVFAQAGTAAITLDSVTITGARNSWSYGQGAYTAGDLDLVSAVVTDNRSDIPDAGSYGGGFYALGDVSIQDSTVSNNYTGGLGGGFFTEGDCTVVHSTVSGNEAGGLTDVTGAGNGGAFVCGDSNAKIVNSTIASNTSRGVHGAVDVGAGSATIVYATFADNVIAPPVAPGSVSGQAVVFPVDIVGATLNAFGSVLNRATGGVHCAVGETNTSGYNFADDQTCGFTDPTDTQGIGAAFDAKLGSLANNGGPTQTLLPPSGSPLINAIPVAACSGGNTLAGFAVTDDQRGVARPQESGCEIGSVELAAPPPLPPPVVLQPTFTG
jgi:hypothetical protein